MIFMLCSSDNAVTYYLFSLQLYLLIQAKTSDVQLSCKRQERAWNFILLTLRTKSFH